MFESVNRCGLFSCLGVFIRTMRVSSLVILFYRSSAEQSNCCLWCSDALARSLAMVMRLIREYSPKQPPKIVDGHWFCFSAPRRVKRRPRKNRSNGTHHSIVTDSLAGFPAPIDDSCRNEADRRISHILFRKKFPEKMEKNIKI
jgi:hypothetical protein